MQVKSIFRNNLSKLQLQIAIMLLNLQYQNSNKTQIPMFKEVVNSPKVTLYLKEWTKNVGVLIAIDSMPPIIHLIDT